MDFGASMFMTDYCIPAAELGRALEERGFESLWNPEHSHIPLSRKTPFPGGGDVPKMYYDAMDPFVTLTAAAAVTKQLKVGTGVCLVIQRDTIQTAARRAVRYGNGWVPIAGRGAKLEDYLPAFKEMLSEAGRSLADVPITMFGVPQDEDTLKRYRDLGVARCVCGLPPEPAEKTLPLLDRWAEIIRKV